jgi:hypothetical protein
MSFGLRVKPGDTIYVTQGTAPEQSARIVELSPSTLVVSMGGRQQNLSEQAVTRIRQRLPDPLWNGAAIGAGVYLGAAALAGGAGGAFEDCDAGCWAANGAISAGIGAAIGVGIDALVKGRKTIYQSADSKGASHVVIRPFVGADARGAALSVAW